MAFLRTVKLPPKLHKGDTVAVVALSDSLANRKKSKLKRSQKHLDKFGLKTAYSDNTFQTTEVLSTPSVAGRVSDIHKATADPKISAVVIAAGGENANQILDKLDYRLIKKNPKIIMGGSDNTSVLNAIWAKTGVVTYYGYSFSGLSSGRGWQYGSKYLKKCLMTTDPITVKQSNTWYEKDYSAPKSRSKKYSNDGWWIVQEGATAGRLVGGEISTMVLLGGTGYMPRLSGSVLMVEQYLGTLATFDRCLHALLMQPGANRIKAIMIGRFQKSANVSQDDLTKLLRSKPELQGVPIVANLDFGHTNPKLTMPIGGTVSLEINTKQPKIVIKEH